MVDGVVRQVDRSEVGLLCVVAHLNDAVIRKTHSTQIQVAQFAALHAQQTLQVAEECLHRWAASW